MTHANPGPDSSHPAEAYSRVTNPERFASLHPYAEDLLSRLSSEYEVEREEGYELTPAIVREHVIRPTIRLTPRNALEAPVQVSFSDFPGLEVRVGRWYGDRFPSCGCDACDEQVESSLRNLSFLIESAVAGNLREELQVPRLLGDAWQITEIGEAPGGPRQASRTRVARSDALRMIQSGNPRIKWEPWSPRIV